MKPLGRPAARIPAYKTGPAESISHSQCSHSCMSKAARRRRSERTAVAMLARRWRDRFLKPYDLRAAAAVLDHVSQGRGAAEPRCRRYRASARAGRSGRGDRRRTDGWRGRPRHRRSSPEPMLAVGRAPFRQMADQHHGGTQPLGQRLQGREHPRKTALRLSSTPLR